MVSRRVAALVTAALVLSLFSAATPSGATGASFDDPDDFPGVLDLKTLSFSTSASGVTYTLETFEPFASAQVGRARWDIDADANGTRADSIEIVGCPPGDTSCPSSGFRGGLHHVEPVPLFEVHQPQEWPVTVERATSSTLSVTVAAAAIKGTAYDRYTVFAADSSPPTPGGQLPDYDQARSPSYPTPIHRLAGTDRIGTAIAASQELYGKGLAHTVVLARADDFPDALTAVGFDGPVLLNPTASLDPRVSAEIQRVVPKQPPPYEAFIVVLGGEAALSRAVADQIHSLGYGVARYAGVDRYETALKIATARCALSSPYPVPAEPVFLATGTDFADALAAGAVARGAHLLLTDGPRLPPGIAEFLARHPTRYAIGGAAAAADPAAVPIVGADRYETARLVTERFAQPRQWGYRGLSLGIANGVNFADALIGGNHISFHNGGLLLTRPNDLPNAVVENLATKSYVDVYLYGGSNSISSDVEAQVRALAR